MEWEELWKLYKDCQPIKVLYAWRYWYIWLLVVLMILAGVGVVVSLSRGWVWGTFLGSPLFLVFTWLTFYIADKSFEREFTWLYTTYGLKHYPMARRRLYLHYVRFLGSLVDQKYTRKDIEHRRHIAEIAERPKRPATQFADHPLFWLLVIVPLVTGLWQLGADSIKQAEFWKTVPPETPLFRVALLGLGGIIVATLLQYFFLWHDIDSTLSRKAQYEDIQRFLQWAEHDIEEAQLLTTRRLRAEAPGA